LIRRQSIICLITKQKYEMLVNRSALFLNEVN
jgi:hypothetical protein